MLDSEGVPDARADRQYVTDYSTANSLGCLDISGRWDEPIIAAVGFDVAQFPRVLNSFVDELPLRPSLRRAEPEPGTPVACRPVRRRRAGSH
ncbi:MAG: hypothetical protein IPQ15_05510 [Betaproteobacteria bacterium]|nr:hypothetical protein [Betaproteobacteria bacterium]